MINTFYAVWILSMLGWQTRSACAMPPNVRVGVVQDLITNRLASDETVAGLKAAAKIMNEEGIAHIKLDILDSSSLAVGTRKAMLQMINRRNDIIIAETASSKAEVAAVVAEANKRVMLTPFATANSITENRRFVFRTCANHGALSLALSHYLINTAKPRLLKTIIFYDESQLYSSDLAKRFKAAFELQGGHVLKLIKASDFLDHSPANSFLDDIKTADFVFIPTYEESSARIVSKLIVLGMENTRIIGADGWQPDDVFKSLVFSKRQNFKAEFISHHNPDATSTESHKFEVEFRRELGRSARTSAAYLAYDTLRAAVEAVKLADSGTQEAIREALSNRVHFIGLTGLIKFSGQQDPQGKHLYLNQFRGPHISRTLDISNGK